MTSKVDDDLATVGRGLRAVTVHVADENERGSGAGVVWDGAGTIVTNAHVVRGRSAAVTFVDGRTVRGDVVARDDARDLAALRVKSVAGVQAADIRSAATLAPGELVVACGNPLGLVGALSAGLVQRRNARWVVADVRLAPGNSGGPLADGTGRVVGINSMVAGGLALAVPSDAVTAFFDTALRRAGTPPRHLGMTLVPAAVRLANGRVAALLVTALDETGVAAMGGPALGDAIVATDTSAAERVGGRGGTAELAALLAKARALEVVRAGKRLTIALPRGENVRAA